MRRDRLSRLAKNDGMSIIEGSFSWADESAAVIRKVSGLPQMVCVPFASQRAGPIRADQDLPVRRVRT